MSNTGELHETTRELQEIPRENKSQQRDPKTASEKYGRQPEPTRAKNKSQ